jgi:hypothetical protein
LFPIAGTVTATDLASTRSIRRAPPTGAATEAVARNIDIKPMTTITRTPVAPGAGAGVTTAKKIENEKVRILERMTTKIRTKGKKIGLFIRSKVFIPL